MTLIRSYCKPPEHQMELSPESTLTQFDRPIMEKLVDESDNLIKTMLTLRLVNKGFGNSLTLFSLIGSDRRFHVQDEESLAFFFDNNLDRHFASVRFGYRVFEAGFTTLAERIVQNGQSPLFDIALENCSIWPYFERFLKINPVSYDKICKSLKGLSLSGYPIMSGLYKLLTSTPNLVALNLTSLCMNYTFFKHGIGDNGLQQMFFNLKKINLSGMSIRSSDLSGILMSINQLEELIIRSTELDELVKTFRESGMLRKMFGDLRKLDIQSSTLLAENLREILSVMSNLEEINLCRVKFSRSPSRINDVNFLDHQCWPNQSNLKKVDMRGLVLSMHDQLHIKDFFPLKALGHGLFTQWRAMSHESAVT